MSVGEIVTYITQVWPDAEFSEAELRILGRAAQGVGVEAAKLAIDDIRMKRASRKPAISWIAQRFEGIRNQGRAQACGLTPERFKNWTFIDTLRYGWAKAGDERAMSMTPEELLDRYWTITAERMVSVYGEKHAPGMASKHGRNCMRTYMDIGFSWTDALAKARWLLEMTGWRFVAEVPPDGGAVAGEIAQDEARE